MSQVEILNSLATQKYTKVLHEEDVKFGAPHHFKVVEETSGMKEAGVQRILCEVDFQEGPIKENGVNGVANEDLINMVIARLQGFQSTSFSCRENAIALTKLEEALMWLRKRTMDREIRGVEGTHKL